MYCNREIFVLESEVRYLCSSLIASYPDNVGLLSCFDDGEVHHLSVIRQAGWPGDLKRSTEESDSDELLERC